MRVLLDNNVNYRFGPLLTGHEVVHVQDIGWEKLLFVHLSQECARK